MPSAPEIQTYKAGGRANPVVIILSLGKYSPTCPASNNPLPPNIVG